ncbi:MAG: M23 family metallopeptidase [Dehalococcoidia bacterium]|nr:M23 family metallopeptidase [Dehalococcoidia bacterium]
MLTRRRLLVLGLAVPFAAACGRGGSEGSDGGVEVGTPVLQRTPTPASTTASRTPVATATPAPTGRLRLDDLTGFAVPVAGACLPDSDNLMPNAPRTYRAGIHEGVDFYPGLACALIAKGTPVLAMFEGTVIRSDLNYEELTPALLAKLRADTAAAGTTPPAALDAYRGRQVWVDHGQGVVTRYCHLSSIAAGIAVGTRVRQGQQVGGVGESGTPESIEAPGTELHLHAEVRLGDRFLGQDLPPGVVRALYTRLFSA